MKSEQQRNHDYGILIDLEDSLYRLGLGRRYGFGIGLSAYCDRWCK